RNGDKWRANRVWFAGLDPRRPTGAGGGGGPVDLRVCCGAGQDLGAVGVGRESGPRMGGGGGWRGWGSVWAWRPGRGGGGGGVVLGAGQGRAGRRGAALAGCGCRLPVRRCAVGGRFAPIR